VGKTANTTVTYLANLKVRHEQAEFYLPVTALLTAQLMAILTNVKWHITIVYTTFSNGK